LLEGYDDHFVFEALLCFFEVEVFPAQKIQFIQGIAFLIGMVLSGLCETLHSACIYHSLQQLHNQLSISDILKIGIA